jgi:hypothetical protein
MVMLNCTVAAQIFRSIRTPLSVRYNTVLKNLQAANPRIASDYTVAGVSRQGLPTVPDLLDLFLQGMLKNSGILFFHADTVPILLEVSFA